jgi:hypothetical protein
MQHSRGCDRYSIHRDDADSVIQRTVVSSRDFTMVMDG